MLVIASLPENKLHVTRCVIEPGISRRTALKTVKNLLFLSFKAKIFLCTMTCDDKMLNPMNTALGHWLPDKYQKDGELWLAESGTIEAIKSELRTIETCVADFVGMFTFYHVDS
jgi:hypothetical protein